MGLQFTANRFKSSGQGLAHNHLDSSSTLPPASDSFITSSNTRLTLLSTNEYFLQRINKTFPQFNNDESLIEVSTADPGIAICITSQRVLLYSIIGSESTPYPLEFPYNNNNESELIPLVKIIPNRTIESKPNLVIVDPSTGILRFIETLNFIPSLTVVQNEQTIKLPLNLNENVTSIQYEPHVGLLVSTSQKRVLNISFFDSLGNVNISTTEIYNNRSLLSYILSKDYLKQKSITCLHVFNESPVVKKILILQNDNTLAIVNHIVSSGIFTLEKKLDLNYLFENNSYPYLISDFDIINNGTTLLLLIKLHTGTFSFAKIDLFDINGPSITSTFEISNSQGSQSGNFYLIDNGNIALVKFQWGYVAKLIIVDINSNLSSKMLDMKQVIVFKPNLRIFDTCKIPDMADNNLRICTNDGILSFTYYSIPQQINNIAAIESRIQQYLLFNSDSSPISLNIFETGFQITQNEIENAINAIVSNILHNKLTTSSSTSIEIPVENLLKRIEITKKLVFYISENFTVSQTVVENVMSVSSLLSLSYSFLETVQTNKLENQIQPLIRDLSTSSLGNYIINNSSEILNIISAFVDINLPLGNEYQIVELGSILKNILTLGYFDVDSYVKSLLNKNKYASPVFVSHSDLLEKVNGLTKQLFNVAAETDKISNMQAIDATINDSICGLSLFLYYSSNDCVAFYHSDSHEFEKFNYFLSSNKKNWIQSFCVLNRQNEILQFADYYKDLESLSMLIDTQREQIYEEELFEKNIAESKGDILFDISPKLLEQQHQIENLFDYYFDKYEYEFASSLFNYYVFHDKINHLLTNFNEKKYVHYLDRYLEENYDNGFYKFAWIKDIRNGNYHIASQKLFNHVQDFNDSIKTKQVLLSISKLSAIASNSITNNNGDLATKSLLANSDYKLQMLELQKRIQLTFGDLLMKKDNAEKVTDDIVKEYPGFKNEVIHVMSLFESHKEVSLILLINVTTLLLLQRICVDKNIFDKIIGILIKILERTNDDNILKIGTKIFWRRIILWNKAEINGGENGDEVADLYSVKFIQYIADAKNHPKLIVPKKIDQLMLTEDELVNVNESSNSISEYLKENEEIQELLINWEPFSSLGDF